MDNRLPKTPESLGISPESIRELALRSLMLLNEQREFKRAQMQCMLEFGRKYASIDPAIARALEMIESNHAKEGYKMLDLRLGKYRDALDAILAIQLDIYGTFCELRKLEYSCNDRRPR